jgi:V/A-type H+-transporting ATPase subunit A
MYRQELFNWWKSVQSDFNVYRDKAMEILTTAAEVESIARIIGEKSLPDDQRLLLLTSELLKEGFLRQNAFDEVDTFSEPEKSALLLKLIIDFHHMVEKVIKKRIPIDRVIDLPVVAKIKRVKFDPRRVEAILEVAQEAREELLKLAEEYRVEVEI